jgi:hypothetical protein
MIVSDIIVTKSFDIITQPESGGVLRSPLNLNCMWSQSRRMPPWTSIKRKSIGQLGEIWVLSPEYLTNPNHLMSFGWGMLTGRAGRSVLTTSFCSPCVLWQAWSHFEPNMSNLRAPSAVLFLLYDPMHKFDTILQGSVNYWYWISLITLMSRIAIKMTDQASFSTVFIICEHYSSFI